MAAEQIEVSTPFSEVLVRSLRAGQKLLISGGAYSCRDVAHNADSRGDRLRGRTAF